jgi:hypothetical protein
VWTTKILQDPGNEGLVEIIGVLSPYVGCRPIGILCGAHILEIDIEDIYFLIRLSHRGAQVTLTGSRGCGDPMSHYVSAHCMPGVERHSGKVAIQDVCDLPLRTILYTIACMAGSTAPHMAL